MAFSVPGSPRRRSSSFQSIADSFLADDGLPFANILSADRIRSTFAKHGSLFGAAGAIYSTAVVLWAFLGQVLRDGKEASCLSAVARVIAHRSATGQRPPSSDTGDYCAGRAKLSEHALNELACDIATELEHASPEQWLWKSLHPKLIDGTTFTMPDTPENQAEYPQMTCQAPGAGFPIARMVAVVSYATACVTGCAIGPYKGKETGETALLRQIIAVQEIPLSKELQLQFPASILISLTFRFFAAFSEERFHHYPHVAFHALLSCM